MQNRKYDIIIAGGGLSGLSLAYFLNRKKYSKNVLIIGKDMYQQVNKTWSYWAEASFYPNFLSKKNWRQIKLKHKQDAFIKTLKRYQYYSIRSHTYFDYVLSTLKKKSNFTLLESRIDSISETDRHVEVVTDRGVFRSDLVFSSLLPKNAMSSDMESDAYLQQIFVGWEIKSDEPVFNDDYITLMDFQQDQQRTNFFYVLPFSSTTALIENTYFDTLSIPYEKIEEQIPAYIKREFGLNKSEYEITYTEKGALPMVALNLEDDSDRLINIGTAAGLMKPSTGYTFKNIIRQSMLYADQIMAGEPLAKPKQSRFFTFLDKIFLFTIRQRPDRSWFYYMRLFKKNRVDDVLAFIEEQISVLRAIGVISKLPKMPFIKTLLRSI